MQRLGICLALVLSGCGATSNPSLEDGSAVPSFAGVRADSGSLQPLDSAGGTPGAGQLTVARVAGSEVDVRALLVRSWWRSSKTVREMLEQLVVERLTLVEAARLGIAVDPRERDEAVEDAWIAMRQRIVEAGSDLEPEDFVRQVLGLDPLFYAEQLASDASVQILLERVVRAWSLTSERSVLSVIAVEDEQIAGRVVSELEAGRPFDELSRAFGIGETREMGLERVTVVHDERVELARIAKLTPVGEFGGPIEEAGRYLVFQVVEHMPAYGGDLSGADRAARRAFLESIEFSFDTQPVEDIEYLQWRAAMERRYEIDLSPFALLVEGRRPGQP